MATEDKERNKKALLYTALVYVGLIGACFLFTFSYPPALPNQDMGMVINLGTSEEGTGTDQPLNANPISFQESEAQTHQTSPASDETGSRSEDILTSDQEDAPVVERIKKEKENKEFSKDLNENVKKTTTTPRPDAPVEPKPTPPKPKALYSGGSSNSSSSGNNAGATNESEGEGLTGNPGDQGAFNGDPTASNHNGRYSGLGGNSLQYRLGGRHIVQYPSREGQFREGGKVTLSIKVDQLGNIVSYSVASADNSTISRLAEQKIKQVKFNANPSAPATQFGEIVFVFKLQR